MAAGAFFFRNILLLVVWCVLRVFASRVSACARLNDVIECCKK